MTKRFKEIQARAQALRMRRQTGTPDFTPYFEETQTRAQGIGSKAYIWRTCLDEDVRPEHRILEGQVIPWDEPPVAGPNGIRYHAGCGDGCRCFAEPILPDIIT